MNKAGLIQQIRDKKNYLCIGLDTDAGKLPPHLKGRAGAVVAFNKAIIEATKEHCVCYKINTAFYESQGIKGWEAMEETLHAIPATHFTIADAKRGDIGNTSTHYAKTFFETLPFDSVTVNPYMGEDSVRPFLEYDDKVTILLGLTSNKGAGDFELQHIAAPHRKPVYQSESSQDHFRLFQHEGSETEINLDETTHHLYEIVLQKAATWGTTDNLMFVAGATQAQQLAAIRAIVPDHFLLVPGVGTQGGSLEDVSRSMNKECGLLVNVSRAVIFAGNGEDFAQKAADKAREYAEQMKPFLS